jgi:hypothetical protein
LAIGSFSPWTHESLATLDDFELEVEQLKRSKEFIAFLDERAKERGKTSIEQLRRELDIG